MGRPILQIPIGKIRLIITNSFGEGRPFSWGEVSPVTLKARFLFFVLGGVLAQGLAIVLCLVMLDISRVELLNIKNPLLGVIFFYANLFQIIFNLIPRKINTFGIPIPNDGLRLILLPSSTSHDIQKMLFYGKIGEAYDVFGTKKFHEAEILLRQCIETYPELPSLKLALSSALIKQLKLEEAQIFLESIEQSYDEKATLFLLYHQLAWTYFLQFTEETLQKAEEYVQQAMTVQPQHTASAGIQGYILLERGMIHEAIAILHTLITPTSGLHSSPVSPILSMYLAYGYYRQQDLRTTREYLAKLDDPTVMLDAEERLVLDHILTHTEQFNGTYSQRSQDRTEQVHIERQPISRGIQIAIGSVLALIAIGAFIVNGLLIVVITERGEWDFLSAYIVIVVLLGIGIGMGLMAYRLIRSRGAKQGGGILASTTYAVLGWAFVLLWILLGILLLREHAWKDFLVLSGCVLMLAGWCFMAARMRRTKQSILEKK